MKTGPVIYVVGLGPGSADQITLGVWDKLKQATHLYLRTEAHPAVVKLQEEGLSYYSFDSIYEKASSFEEVYKEIVQSLVTAALEQKSEIVYAVPGHPSVAEQTVQLLTKASSERGVRLHIGSGGSFLDPVFNRLQFDPIAGFQLLDGTELKRWMIQPRLHQVVAQVYDAYIASDVKLTLMEVYPDDYRIIVAQALGVEEDEQIRDISLYELDRLKEYGNLCLVYIPATNDRHILHRQFDQLHETVRFLRSPEGCPWDREQTHQSIRRHLIEETYEVLETIDDDDPDAMREELGDLLMQVMLHAQMEEEAGVFNAYDVIQTLNDKLVRRHPHVFGNRSAGNAEEALQNWEQIKLEEKQLTGKLRQNTSLLSGVPRDLPELLKAFKYQKKAAEVGFDWEEAAPVLAKIDEELQELRDTLEDDTSYDEAKQQARREEELGDLLFTVVNAARILKIDPEAAMAQANRKFVHRFQYIEQQLKEQSKDIKSTSLSEMEMLWQAAKKLPPRS